MQVAFASMNKWLTLNFDNLNVIKCCINSKTCINLNVRYDNKTTEEVKATKFLSPQIESRLNWKKHI
jgi:hypothetical protein